MDVQLARKWKRTLVNVFIALHVVALFLWGLPGNRFASTMLQPVRPYVMFSGLWHTWNMFGEAICTIQMDLRAQVKYKDGTQAEWIAPRMHELPWWKRVPKERYRKWRELNFHDEFAPSWASSARFIARQMNRNPTNPPVQVSLTRFWAPTPPINRKSDYQPLLRKYIADQSYTYSVVRISPEDL
jgi:hypothetical protein